MQPNARHSVVMSPTGQRTLQACLIVTSATARTNFLFSPLLDICNLPLLSSDAKKVSSKPQLLQLLPKVDKKKIE